MLQCASKPAKQFSLRFFVCLRLHKQTELCFLRGLEPPNPTAKLEKCVEALSDQNGFYQLDWGNGEEKYLASTLEAKIEAGCGVALLGPPCFEFDDLRASADNRRRFLQYFRALLTFLVSARASPSDRDNEAIEEVHAGIPTSMGAGPESEAIFCVASGLSALESDWSVYDAGWMFFYGTGAPNSWPEVADGQKDVEATEEQSNRYISTALSYVKEFCESALEGKSNISRFYLSEGWQANSILRFGLLEFKKFCDEFSEFSFWMEWYQSNLDGNPLNWDLQTEIMLIPSKYWDNGAESISEKIREIRARKLLEDRIAELEKQIPKRSRLGIGGNNPPEEIGRDAAVEGIEVVWVTLDDLKAQTDQHTPNKGTVEKIAISLKDVLRSITDFSARLGEHAIKVAITSGVSAGTATLIAKPQLLEGIIAAVKAWLPFL